MKKTIKLKAGTIKLDQNEDDSKMNYRAYEIVTINDGYSIDDIHYELAKSVFREK
jgi:hypothetical protein